MSTASLSQLCELITDGTHYTPPDVGVGVPFLTVKDMSPSGLDFEGCSRISPEEFQKAKAQNSAPARGDVLFSKDGTVGKVHVVAEETEFAVLSSIAILRPDPAVLDAGFAAHYLRSPEALAAASQRKTGSALTRIILKDLKQLRLPVPPLAEQKRIAAILDQADELRRKRQRAIDHLNQLGQAIFFEMFGDFETNSRDFGQVSLAKLIKVQGGYAFKSDLFKSEGAPVIRISNVDGRSVDVQGATRIAPCDVGKGAAFTVGAGDLLIAMSGATTGKIGIVPEFQGQAYLNQRVGKYVILDGSRIERGFLIGLVQTKFYQKRILEQAWGAAQPNVSSAQLVSFDVPLPPLALQRRYADAIADLESQLEANQSSYSTLNRLFLSLQNRAFQGEL